MYLTASRPDIMFAFCTCARFQVTPMTSHLHAVKMIFRYLKGLPKLGLWYPRNSPFDLESFSDNDYAGASLDRKSTTGVANSTTEAEYVAAANCRGQNPVFHSKTKHIEIRHHFIRYSYEKKLIQLCLMRFEDDISDEFGVKTDNCKVNAARQDLVLLGKVVSWRLSHDSGDGGVDEGGVRVEPRWGEDLISVCVERVVAGISAGASGLGGREKYKGVRSVVCEAVIKELP
ncbi:hypothetical protein Tco_0674126 [Tanacetum coccineum]